MNFKFIDLDTYYRKGVFTHFSKDCKCSLSITNRIDVTALVDFSKRTNTKFYINFLYVLSNVLNSREDYRLCWDYKNSRLLCWDKINPAQYIFHEDTETFTLAYTEYDSDYKTFYERALKDADEAKATRKYRLDSANHPNWFDASCIPWLSYDSLHLELPDGYLYFNPIVNRGRFEKSFDGSLKMPVTVRLNHAAADGYLVALVFKKLEDEIMRLANE